MDSKHTAFPKSTRLFTINASLDRPVGGVTRRGCSTTYRRTNSVAGLVLAFGLKKLPIEKRA
jgi:hypothetical protein